MKYTQLGNTGIEVSRICVGCMSYGKPSEEFHLWTLNQEETTKMIKHALDLSDEDAAYLEEPYKAHEVVGAL